ncbi:MAG: metal-binding protein [Armatimonadetes bacterium]|nr:metal-binding protein [Armatimonadota bacterium]
MPDGKTHDRLTVLGAALAVPAWLLLAPPAFRADYVAAGTLAAATLFSGLMLSPDLDLDSSIYRRWGVFRFLWWPYMKAMPHRSFLSHSYVIAPLIRVAYFLLVCYVLFRAGSWLAHFVVPHDRNGITDRAYTALVDFPTRHPAHFWATAIGTIWGTALHVGADTFSTRLQKANPFRRRRR